MEGGIEYLRDVIVNDRLGIAADLERQMQYLVDTYKCEWAEVVRDPEKRRLFKQFVNTDETEPTIEFVQRAGAAAAGGLERVVRALQRELTRAQARNRRRPEWVNVGKVWDFPADGGATVQHGKTQIAVFHFAEPRRVVRQPEHVPAQARVRPVPRPPGRPERHTQGRLSATQEDLLAGDRRVPDGRGLPRRACSR